MLLPCALLDTLLLLRALWLLPLLRGTLRLLVLTLPPLVSLLCLADSDALAVERAVALVGFDVTIVAAGNAVLVVGSGLTAEIAVEHVVGSETAAAFGPVAVVAVGSAAAVAVAHAVVVADSGVTAAVERVAVAVGYAAVGVWPVPSYSAVRNGPACRPAAPAVHSQT